MEARVAKPASDEIGRIGAPRERCRSDFVLVVASKTQDVALVRTKCDLVFAIGGQHMADDERSVGRMRTTGSRSTRPPQRSGCSSAITRPVPQSAA